MNIRWIQEWLTDRLFPDGNACHLCGRGLDAAGILCHRCLEALSRCRYSPTTAALSARRRPLSSCITAYTHRAEARELVHRLKYASDPAVAQALGEGMGAVLMPCPVRPRRIDMIVPVPLHLSRLETRGYNQALLLAQAVSRHTGVAPVQEALIRLIATDTQITRDREARLLAMQNAFAVTSPALVRGKTILLVDDVLTTGATAMSCAATLMEAGARRVTLLTACRA